MSTKLIILDQPHRQCIDYHIVAFGSINALLATFVSSFHVASPEASSHSLEVKRMLPMKQAREPKTVFIDLRSREQERTSPEASYINGKMRLACLQDER